MAATTISATRKLGNAVSSNNNSNGLPIITEKSDTQSVASVNETERDVDEIIQDTDKKDKEGDKQD